MAEDDKIRFAYRLSCDSVSSESLPGSEGIEMNRKKVGLIAIFVSWHVLQVSGLDAICERIDFNDISQNKVQKCSGADHEIFRLKSYGSSKTFKPYRENTNYYLGNEVLGISCCETEDVFYMHEYTEIRLIYQLVFQTTSTLTLRILDMEQLENGEPTVVQRWSSQQATNTWSLFVGRVEREIRRAKLQIEVYMTNGAEVGIEYVTVFNSLVQEQFCKELDEFYSTPAVPTTTTPRPTVTTTMRPTTVTTTQSSTTTTTTTTTTTPRPTTMSTIAPTTTTRPTTTSTIRPTTTRTSTPLSTSTITSPSTSTSTESTTTQSTTTQSTTIESTSSESTTTEINLTTSEPPPTTSETATEESTTILPTPLPVAQRRSEAVWMVLTGVFITLFLLTVASGVYIYTNSRLISRTIIQEFGPKTTNHHANNHHPTPLDQTIHRKLQQQLKNRLRQQHSFEAEDTTSNNSSRRSMSRDFEHSKYPRGTNVNLNRSQLKQDGGFRDDISELKYQNRMNKL